MRELKFRVWTGKEYLDDFNLNRISAGANGSLSVIGYPGVIVEQFTGLRDRNLSDIFEGDVVIYTEGIHNDTCIGYIEFNVGHASFLIRNTGNEKWSSKTRWLRFDEFLGNSGNIDISVEVIGNVHENGDLLK